MNPLDNTQNMGYNVNQPMVTLPLEAPPAYARESGKFKMGERGTSDINVLCMCGGIGIRW